MNILVAHNFYQQAGGEDIVFNLEVELLRSHGHRVTTFTATNHQLKEEKSISNLAASFWSSDSYQKIKKLIEEKNIGLAHFHNTFFVLSPAVYQACKDMNIPVVQTLHNYRWICPAGTLFRNGQVCEQCVDHYPLPGIIHKCYRNSYSQTFALANSVFFHRDIRRTLADQVDKFIVLSHFAKDKFIEGGFPKEKMVVKPNFIHQTSSPSFDMGKGFLFVGRLTAEKGIQFLLETWDDLGIRHKLSILGDGPLKSMVSEKANKNPFIDYKGSVLKHEVIEMMRQSRALLFPSLWYEGFPMVILEAISVGLPVIASHIGGIPEIIQHQHNGFLFKPGKVDDLYQLINQTGQDKKAYIQVRKNAHRDFKEQYSGEVNYAYLNKIYQEAMDSYQVGTVT